ncbi:MmcQ/YjbR family DNA-binding protein [Candidatus Saccharibacteria bacterium]|nr:MmcQ/YjbR family DNA-binding protein [Candidatus Saccharibacteria bacterium]
MTTAQLDQFFLSFAGVEKRYPFGEGEAAYYYTAGDEAVLFAIIQEQSTPLRIRLKCDPKLAVMLRENYETVLAAENLHKKYWNSIICTGQLSDEQLLDLARHSYELGRGTHVVKD